MISYQLAKSATGLVFNHAYDELLEKDVVSTLATIATTFVFKTSKLRGFS